MNLFRRGDFTVNSGAKSAWKIDCDALVDEDIQTLAMMIRQLVGPFSSVEGVPEGGKRLADVLWPLSETDGTGRVHLIVDDVLTTGRSMTHQRRGWEIVCPHGEAANIKGAVIFARGPCPSWVKALFQLPEALWLKPGEQP